MNIAIIGSGNIGANLGLHFAKAGHHVFFTSRHPEKLTELVEQAGEYARAGTVEEAANFSELFLLATPYKMLPEVGKQLDTAVQGRIVIDAANPYVQRDGQMARAVIQSGTPASTHTAQWFRGAEIVKAFNTIYADVLRDRAFPTEGETPLAVPYAADSVAARETIEELIKDIGMVPFYSSTIADSKELDPNGNLYGMTGTLEDFEQKLAGRDTTSS